MPGIVELAAYTAVNILPLLALALLPFRDSLRLPGRWVALLAAALCAVDGWTSWLAMQSGAGVELTVLCVFLYLGFYLAAVRSSPLKLLAVLLILMNFASLATVTADFLIYLIKPEAFYRLYSWEYTALYALGLGLAFPMFYRLLDRRIRPQVTAGHAERFWRYLWAVPATFCAVYYYMIFSAGSVGKFSRSWKNVLFLWAINAGGLLVTDMMARLLEEGRENLRLQSSNSQLALQLSQYEFLQQSMEQTRRARHDLRHHWTVLQKFIDSGDQTALEAYVREHLATLPPDSGPACCKNFAANAVLCYYGERAAQAGVEMEVSFQMGERAVISEPELCVLLSNLLENALEAAAGGEGAPFIRVSARQTGGNMLSLTVDNTSPRPPRRQGEQLLSNKRDGPGLGTESVRAIAARYSGDARFSWRDGIFYASVMLNP